MVSKVLISDDHGIVRQGVRSLLERQEDIKVVAEAEDGFETLLMVRKFKPDVVVFDVNMPSFNAIEMIQQLLKEFPCVKLVALSKQIDEIVVNEMFQAGICGYIFKDRLFEEIISAIRTVSQGRVYLSPIIKGLEVGGYVKHLAEDSNFENVVIEK